MSTTNTETRTEEKTMTTLALVRLDADGTYLIQETEADGTLVGLFDQDGEKITPVNFSEWTFVRALGANGDNDEFWDAVRACPEFCRAYRVTGSPGDDTIAAPTEVIVLPSGDALALHAGQEDEAYDDLSSLLSAYTLDEDDLDDDDKLTAAWRATDAAELTRILAAATR